MGSFPALPALQVRPAPDPVESLMRITSLQTGQLQAQQLQQQVADQRALTAAMREWDGKDVNDLYPLVLTHGGSANAVLGLKSALLAQQEKFSTIAKNDADTGAKRIETMQKANDSLAGHLNTLDKVPDDKLVDSAKTELAAARNGGYIDPAHAQVMDNLLSTNDPTKIRPALDLFRKGLMTESQQLDEATKTATAQGALLRGQAAAGELTLRQTEFAAKLDPNSPLYDPSTAYLAKRAQAGDQEAQSILAGQVAQAGRKAGAEAAAKFPYELKLKQEEVGQNPAFAFNPKTGQRELTTIGDAKQNGWQFAKVGQGDIEKETSLNSQMNDMQLNTSRYRVALNAMGQLSKTDVANMAHIISDPNVNNAMLNIAGMPALMSMIEQGGRARDWNALSPDKQDALIGYLRMKNTALLSQKVLTGIGRASKEAMDVEIANMPSPIEGATVGNKKLDAWQENLDQINSRSVKLPWMETPADVRKRVEGQ